MNLKIKNRPVSQKPNRNICKVSVMKNLSHKQVKKSINKNKNNIPVTYL